MDKDTAIARIDEALRDSGNGDRNFYSVEEYLDEAIRTGDIIDSGEYGKYVFIKPASGYEVEIELEVVEAALGQ